MAELLIIIISVAALGLLIAVGFAIRYLNNQNK